MADDLIVHVAALLVSAGVLSHMLFVIERDGAVVLIDETSLQFLQGARIDYAEDLMAAAFKIENPNASSSCGCGTSFAV